MVPVHARLARGPTTFDGMPARTHDTQGIRSVLSALTAPGADWHALVLGALDAGLGLTGAGAAAVFTPGEHRGVGGDGGGAEGGSADLVALRGERAQTTDAWLRAAAAAIPVVLSRNDTAVVAASAREADSGFVVLGPIALRDGARAVLALHLPDADRITAEEQRERAMLIAAVMTGADLRAAGEARSNELTRLSAAMGVVRAASDAARFKGAAIALCNTLASELDCDRVTLGWVRAHQARTIAMSHADKVVRRLPLLRDIEGAMEEALDQDEDVVFSPSSAAPMSGTITRAAERLSAGHGGSSVAVMPLRVGGERGALVGALTLERGGDRAWTAVELASVRAVADLSAPMLLRHRRDDAWVGAKLLESLRRTGAVVVGPRHTIAKLVALGCVALLAALVFVRMDYTVPASFVFQAEGQRVVAAPVDAVLLEASLAPGDAVVAGQTVMARFDTTDLLLEAAAVRAERAAQERQAVSARRSGDATTAAIHDALADEAAARLALVESRIRASTVLSPLTGVVLSGTPEQFAGALLSQGEPLYRVAPGGAEGGMRAEVLVPQRFAVGLEEGQIVRLASSAYPDRRVDAVVERIAPAAEEVDGRGGSEVRFRVIARVDEPREWMRSGMGGEARLTVGRRSLLSAWTSDLVDWVRLKLWL